MADSLRPPQYLRKAKFVNGTGRTVVVKVSFGSNAEEVCVIEDGAYAEVERNIDHGTWLAVDPIRTIVVDADGSESLPIDVSVGGVEIHEYKLHLAGDRIVVQKCLIEG
eukprot:TRINITY_DN1746_c0_g2_i1.p2 TRINITY_DN1746_c0_g2~~TRINITY_DN1746_c0_g2_i1.p2  ORF type:complete len:128 (+),score=19.20 TRINITY_DN1746_c0_g2_i1:58-384(+)